MGAHGALGPSLGVPPGRPLGADELADVERMAGRLARLAGLAAEHVAAGRIVPGWYARHRAAGLDALGPWAERLGVVGACGVLSALSPRVRWETVLQRARDVLDGRPSPFPGRSEDAARRIRDGEVTGEVLHGPKVSAFARALAGDPEPVVVDVWTARACGLDPERLTPRRYAQAALAHRWVAAAAVLDPAELQARVWALVREVDPGALHGLAQGRLALGP